jgi:hypothetical protein
MGALKIPSPVRKAGMSSEQRKNIWEKAMKSRNNVALAMLVGVGIGAR